VDSEGPPQSLRLHFNAEFLQRIAAQSSARSESRCYVICAGAKTYAFPEPIIGVANLRKQQETLFDVRSVRKMSSGGDGLEMSLNRAKVHHPSQSAVFVAPRK
jgi:hypothetical protein